MNRDPATIEAMLDDMQLTLDELCRLGGVSAPWVAQRLEHGLLGVFGDVHGRCFDAAVLRRVRCMARLERDFDAVPELAALVVDLQDEIAALRAQLARLRR